MIKFYSAILLSLLAINSSQASSNTSTTTSSPTSTTVPVQSQNPVQTTSEQSKYQAIIDEYKKYLLTVDKKTRDEIIKFRKEMLVINQQKKELYKSLSQEAQLFLEKEKAYKKKLPINKKKEINIINQD